ncbi:MAG: glycosyl transferase [Thermodesulfobacteriota bacterium]
MSRRYYCTYFDHRYLLKGLALHESLLRHAGDFSLFILCLSSECYEILSRLSLPRVRLISLAELERGDAELLQAKGDRSLVEYYFTLTPSLPLYIFRLDPEVDLLTYLDSDLYFFADPEPLYEEIGENSVALIGHRFPPHLKALESHGKYNVGWLSFRRDDQGLAGLKWYRKRCNEWCYDRVEEGRFADQKYLDYLPGKFSGVIELAHKGANLAPWNIANYSLTRNAATVMIDEYPLIFYHFQGLKQIWGPIYDSGLFGYRAALSSLIREEIYKPYLASLIRQKQRLPYELEEKKKLREEQAAPGWLEAIRGLRRYSVKELFKIIRLLTANTYIFYSG